MIRNIIYDKDDVLAQYLQGFAAYLHENNLGFADLEAGADNLLNHFRQNEDGTLKIHPEYIVGFQNTKGYSELEPYKDAKEVVLHFHVAGFRQFIATACGMDFHKIAKEWSLTNFGNHIEKFYTAPLNGDKPDKSEMYKEIITENKLKPSETAIIDDIPANLRMARQVDHRLHLFYKRLGVLNGDLPKDLYNVHIVDSLSSFNSLILSMNQMKRDGNNYQTPNARLLNTAINTSR